MRRIQAKTLLPLPPLLPLLAVALLLSHCSCDFFGTTGALFISEADESKMGAEFDRQLRDSVVAYPVYKPGTDAEKMKFEKYVKDLADEIVSKVPAAEKPEYKFTFTLIDKDVENAFAVPAASRHAYRK